MPPSGRRLLTALIALLTVSAVFLIAVPAAAASSPHTAWAGSLARGPLPSAAAEVDPAVLRFANAPELARPYWEKMSPSIQDAALSASGRKNVAILTEDVNELGAFLRAAGVDTRIGSVPAAVGPPRVVTVDVPVPLLEKIAALGGVYSVAPAVLPEVPAAADPDLPPLSSGPAPTLMEAGKGHHVPEAWALGFNGDGVIVAPMDSGTDFGHPDLQGTFARVPDPGSPYYLWPIAFDPNSMASYLLAGATFPLASSSWYVNTSHTTPADPVTGLITSPFQGRTYNVSGIPSASGLYHIGLHPDRTLRFDWGYNRYVGLLLTDSAIPFVYDTIYVDLDNDNRFWDDKPADLGSPEIWADYWDGAVWDNSTYSAGDGIADMSGGLVYFIADGTNPIPYSDVIASRYGLPLLIPGNGDLVALQIGDVRAPGGGDHGTLVASSIVAQNVTGTVLGFAPGARIISVGNIYAGGFFYDIYQFVGEGYDAMPGTGDEAQVASASFGVSAQDNDGWDFESRWVELNALSYFLTTYVVSTGNGGHGFGTVTPPGGSGGVIGVGASTSYNAALGDFDTAAHSTFGDVQPWSNRGPSALGQVKPDVVTVGAWASGDGALNSFGGTDSPWIVWGGTSLSAPATAAIAALVVNAWQLTVGGPAVNYAVRAFLTGSADNIHYDPLVMGHGITNAYRAVRAASIQDGVAAYDPTSFSLVPKWVAGDYRGTPYESFGRIMSPGGVSSAIFEFQNLNRSATKDFTISDWELQRIGSDTWNVTAANANESTPDFLRPDYLIDLTPYVPASTNLLRATVSFPLSELDPDGNYVYNSRWRVLLYDWLDYNGNGSYWDDADSNGVVNAGEMDETMGMEVSRFTYGYPTHTNIEVSVHDPLARIHDGLLLGIQHRTVSSSVPVTNFTVTVEYYEAVDAPWLSTDIAFATVPPAGIQPMTLTVTLPPSQPYGTLSGAVTIANGSLETQIPVIVNVAANGTSFAFGGDPGSTAFLDNNRVFGGIDWTWRAEAGDWRFFYTDIPDSTPVGPGDRLLVHTWWENVPTDIDTIVMGPTLDLFSSFIPSYYGPYTLETVGASARTLINAGRWSFQTATGVADEWVSAPLATGLHAIVLHNVLFAGLGPSEVFEGETGTFHVDPVPWNVFTSNGTGTGTFTANASLDLPGLEVRAYGIAPPSFDPAVPITDLGEYVETFTASSIGLIDVQTDGPGGMDIDLYLDRWTGSVWSTVASSAGPTAAEQIRLSMPSDGTYRIRVFGYAVPGGSGFFSLYSAVIAGTELTPQNVPTVDIPAGTPASFDVAWDLDLGTLPGFYVGVLFVGPEGAPSVALPANFFLSDTQAPTILATDPAPGASVRDTTPSLVVDYEDPRVSTGVVWVTFSLDGMDLTFAATWNETRLTWGMPFALGEGAHTANVTVYDGAGFVTSYEWTFTIDTTAPSLSVTAPLDGITNQASAMVQGTTEPGATVLVNGVPASVDGSGGFVASVTLAEGPNTITIVATDSAGNSATVTRAVVLDTVPPALAVDVPAPGASLTRSVVTVSGTTEPGADLTVNGIRVVVDGSGAWTVNLALQDGTQDIVVRAVDAAGNAALVTRGVTVDTVAPTITLTSPLAPLTNSRNVVVSGLVSDPAATVTVNGVPATLVGTVFSLTLAFTADGTYTIAVVAVDPAGNSATVLTGIVIDTVAPTVTVTRPLNGAETEQPAIEFVGTIDDPDATVLVNGQRVRPEASGDWTISVALLEGANSIAVSAVDAAGNVALERLLLVTYTSPVPGIQDDITGNTQAINGLSGNLILGLVAVLVILVALQLVLYWNLNRKIGSLKGVKAEPPKEPEGKGEP